jgi:hypothetical protein
MATPATAAPTHSRLSSVLRRSWESDLAYSFRHSPYAIGAAVVFVVINLAVDLLYYAVDPRLRIERGAAH